MNQIRALAYALMLAPLVIAPANARTVNITATPQEIQSGQTSTLQWTSSGWATCQGSGFLTGGATSGSRIVAPTQTTQYGVTCSRGGSRSQSVSTTVVVGTVPPPPPPGGPILPPPVTTNGSGYNYATGCSGGSCKTFDAVSDTGWPSTMDLTKWRPGLYDNGVYLFGTGDNTGRTSYCGGNPGQFPFSGWNTGNGPTVATNSEILNFMIAYPYGYSSDPTASFYTGTKAGYLARQADGTLDIAIVPNNYWNGKTPSGCAYPAVAYWGAGAITSIETAGTSTLIPHTGGLMQWRSKMDTGLLYGEWPGMQCFAVQARGTDYNVNLEFGYNWTGNPMTNVGLSLNNKAVATGNFSGATGPAAGTGVAQVTGDLTTDHIFAVEYSGDGASAGTWRWYVDGVMQVQLSAAGYSPTAVDYQCSWFNQLINGGTGAGFHTVSDGVHLGPFHWFVSDIQYWKKPGT